MGTCAISGRAGRWFWNAYASVYDGLPRHFRPYARQMRRVAELLESRDLPATATVLDAGCGTGNYLAQICAGGHRAVGLDSSPHMLARARRKLARTRSSPRLPGGQLCLSSLEGNLPFADGTFDCVISINALYMMREPQSTLREFCRVLRPQGSLILSHPQRMPSLVAILMEHCRKFGLASVIRPAGTFAALGLFNWAISRSFARRRYHCWPQAELEAQLSAAGFHVESVESTYACDSNLLVCAVVRGERQRAALPCR